MQPTHLLSPIRFEILDELQPRAEISAVFKAAPEKRALGQPGQKTGDIFLVEKPGGGYILVVSLGPKEKISTEIIRRAGGALGQWLIQSGVDHIDLDLDTLKELALETVVPALLEGARLGAYRFIRYIKSDGPDHEIRLTLRGGDGPERNAQVAARVTALTDAVLLARDLAHEPANVINPITLAGKAENVARQNDLHVKVLDDKDLLRMGAGAIMSVGQGSRTPPRLIILEYDGQMDAGTQPVVLVGKAITFDTGGYSIKTTDGIVGMKYDKCGGIDILAILQAAAALKIKTPVVGIIGAAENMISAEAYRPDDIITSLSGKTIEIISTDAEGRLVLGDALTYAQRSYHPRAIIDLATLTGGVVTALGRVRAGLMSNNDDLADRLILSGEKTFERLWRLPLDEDYVNNMKGSDADLKNSGGREGHPVLGGAFLSQFIENDTPWAHLDIAGVADTPKDLPYSTKGATGFGVRLLIDYLEQLEYQPG